ncbi:MAG: SpoIID/LytB domain-containing protein [Acidobacteria bacterium]|nr:SpoIID/LytB domain-containing protein [Acidobacteriota bacterium]
MKRFACLSLLVLLTSCTTSVPSSPTPPQMPPPLNQTGGLTPWTGAVPLPEPIRIRVGLASDLAEMTFPRIEGGYLLVAGEGAPLHTRRGFSVLAPSPSSAIEYGVQVAALADAASASDLASQLEAAGHPALVVEAASGLHRIFAGRFADQSAATALREQLIDSGYGSDIHVAKLPAPATFERIVRVVDDEGESRTLATGSLIVAPAESETIPIGDHRYRGAAIAHVNERGLLNVINVLNLEDYVRGVVPNELGPTVYDEIEALKAQAMAARTYAVKRRGDYEREGYDICPTPACQVYEGFRTEHELSDRAVEETTGMIMTYEGEPIDALYTSTCGGETSNVATMFPSRNEPYLRHVRCVESDYIELAGRRSSAPLSSAEMNASSFRGFAGIADAEQWSAAAAERSVTAAAKIAGLDQPKGFSLGSTNRGPVLEYLANALRFGDLQEPLLLPEDIQYFFPEVQPSPATRAAGFINKYRIGPAQILDPRSLAETMPRDELQAILYGWLEQQGAVAATRGRITGLDGQALTLRVEGSTRSFDIPGETRLYQSISDQIREQEIVHVLVSDRARILHDRAGKVRGIIIDANYDGAAFDRTSSYSSWVRSYSADELAASLRKRRPIDSVVDLTPVSRDEAGRIEAIDVISRNGDRTRIEGLPVRWSLNVPDNLFTFVRTEDSNGVPRFTFWGKGWGHGTGMCQVGAMGRARAGQDYRTILRTYYAGSEITDLY